MDTARDEGWDRSPQGAEGPQKPHREVLSSWPLSWQDAKLKAKGAGETEKLNLEKAN